MEITIEYTDEMLMRCRAFPELRNDRILRVIDGDECDLIPIWIMRQAGRYLPEFQELRKKHSFFEICETPALACEATLMPVNRFALDAAIIFSDILVVPKALGMPLIMEPNVGPVFTEPLTVDRLNSLNVDGVIDRLTYVGKAISLTRHKLSGVVPLIGFSGAPWTLMAYMIEGGGSKTQSKAKKWLYAHVEESHKLLRLLTDVIIDYLVMQIEAGAQAIQIFDSNAEYLNRSLYLEFGVPYLKDIKAGVRDKLEDLELPFVPMIIFAKGAHYCLPEITDLGYDVIGVDWTVPPATARAQCNGLVLQGNLDPCALYCNDENKLKDMVEKMVADFGNVKFIANLGHGIYPDVKPEAVEKLIDIVHNIERL